jgi:diaminopimelate decarboxylase
VDEPDAAELIAAHPCLRAHAMDGLLFEGAPLASIAAAHGTPCWVTGAGTLRRRLRRLRAAMGEIAIHYAIKANDQLATLSVMASEGAGADAVSIGECRRALRAGIPAARIVFSGVGKTGAELQAALALGIGQINVESEEELHELSAVAHAMGATARIALRVNPDVDAGTLDGIATGRAGDKFGIPYADVGRLYAEAQSLPGLSVAGLAVHIGSQVASMSAFARAYARMSDLVRALRSKGLTVSHLDCGGGLAIPYQGEPSILPEAWAGCIRTAFAGLELDLAIEPGRWLAGPAGLLLASVVRVRRAGLPRPIVILDAAMNDLARPAMYGAWHGVLPVSARALHASPERADIAGPVCESSDMFARDRLVAPLQAGELVAILDCGAYGSTMSSTYNARPLAACVMTGLGDARGFVLTRQRGRIDELWASETQANTLGQAA